MTAILTKFAPVIVLVLNALGVAVSPTVAAFWASHLVLASVLAPLAVFFPQPHK